MNVADKEGYRNIDGDTDLLKTYSVFYKQYISAVMVDKGPAGMYYNPKAKNVNYIPYPSIMNKVEIDLM